MWYLVKFLSQRPVYSHSDTKGSSHHKYNVWKYACSGLPVVEHHRILALSQMLRQASHRQQRLGKSALWGPSWSGGERVIWSEAVTLSGSRWSNGVARGSGACAWPDTPDWLRVPDENVSLGKDARSQLHKRLSRQSKVPLQQMEPFGGEEEPWKRQACNSQSKTWYLTGMRALQILHKPNRSLLGPSRQLLVWRIFRNPVPDKLWNVTVLWKVMCHSFYEWNQPAGCNRDL